MELESLFGLPAHPLLVHGALVLLPLAVVGTLALVVGAGATWSVVDVGHSGAKATWATVQDEDGDEDDHGEDDDD